MVENIKELEGYFLANLKAKNWRELIKPQSIAVGENSHTGFYGKFVCEPLERGFGITIGNTLRRILLSSLQGAAIVSVKFKNVVHEFSTIEGVLEDVTDIISTGKTPILITIQSTT